MKLEAHLVYLNNLDQSVGVFFMIRDILISHGRIGVSEGKKNRIAAYVLFKLNLQEWNHQQILTGGPTGLLAYCHLS